MTETFPQALARLRESAGLTHTQLARKLGVSGPFIHRMERGQSRPSLQTLHRLADVFGVSMDELTGREP